MDIKIKADLNNLESKILNKSKDMLSKRNYNVNCPKCNSHISASAGNNICPFCNHTFDLELNFNF